MEEEKPEIAEDQTNTIIDELSKNTMLSFIMSDDGQTYMFLNIKEFNDNTKAYFADFLAKLNSGHYVYDIMGLLDQIVDLKPEQENFINELKMLWFKNLRELTNAGPKGSLGEDLVIKPTEFIKYPNFSGNNR